MSTIYESYGINYVWYLEIEHVDETNCKILRHWRVHHGAENHPTVNGKGQFTILETHDDEWGNRNYEKHQFGDPRIADRVLIATEDGPIRLNVVNKGGIFDYR